MIFFVLVVFGIYYFVLLALIAGWQIATHSEAIIPAESADGLIRVSVVIPFRNEEKNLASLIESINNQTLKEIEVILVNDNSIDSGKHLVQELIRNKSSFHLISSQGVGKKPALTAGITASKGDIIVTTDADCRFHPDWLRIILRRFEDPDVKLVFGSVKIDSSNSFFARIQSMEFASVLGTGVASFALGFPLYCNGANLAFRKDTFLEVKGYEGNLDIPSGDDEFLFKKINARYPKGIRFLNESDGLVITTPQESLGDLIHQRLRWAGKWRYASHLASGLVATMFAVVQVMVLVLLLRLMTNDYPSAFLLVLLGKIFLEFIFIFLVQQNQQEKTRLIPFLLLQLIYPFYFLGTAAFSFFTTYNWKGRMWRNRV